MFLLSKCNTCIMIVRILIKGQLQQVQNMIKWSSDYFLKAHITSNGATVRFYGQVGQTTPDHNYWGRPEDMTMARPAYFVSPTSPGSDLAGETVAALAATSIVFSTVNASYSAQCLLNAKQLYTFAKTYQAKYDQSITDAAAAYAYIHSIQFQLDMNTSC